MQSVSSRSASHGEHAVLVPAAVEDMTVPEIAGRATCPSAKGTSVNKLPRWPIAVRAVCLLMPLWAAACSFDTSPLYDPDPSQPAPSIILPMQTIPRAQDAGQRPLAPNVIRDAAIAPASAAPSTPNNALIPNPTIPPPPTPTSPALDAGVASYAGSAAPNPPIDASDLDAAIAITTPSACRVGLYSGTFSCGVDTLGTILTTSISFDLELATPTAASATTSSNISFMSDGAAFSASMSGQLDCASGVFHADIVNGMNVIGAELAVTTFMGMVDGRVDAVAGTLGGTWSLGSVAGIGACTGIWSAPLPH
jgi:hypothetical protein